MALVRIPGGIWCPTYWPRIDTNALISVSDAGLVDADQEEVQIFGYVCLAAGSGTKTFSTSSPSSIQWLPGASITFAASSTLNVGLKKSTIDSANGPPARATLAVAGFDVYKALVGGTDTITSTTWREDVMASGSNTSVTHGDLVCIAFHLATTGGTPSIKIRGQSQSTASGIPAQTLVTSGPTYTAISVHPNIILTFSDGTIGWLEGSVIFSATANESIGNSNLCGNIFQFPFPCAVDAIMVYPLTTAGTTNYTVGLWSSPLGTIASMTSISADPQVLSGTAARAQIYTLPTEQMLSANTPYAAAVQQNSATNLTIFTEDVSDTSHLQANGLDFNTYAVKSTAGGSFAAQNSGKRRYGVSLRLSQIDSAAQGVGSKANYGAGVSALG